MLHKNLYCIMLNKTIVFIIAIRREVIDIVVTLVAGSV